MIGHRPVRSESKPRYGNIEDMAFLGSVTGQKLSNTNDNGENVSRNQIPDAGPMRLLGSTPITLNFSSASTLDPRSMLRQSWSQFASEPRPPSRATLASRRRERLHLHLESLVSTATRDTDYVLSDLRHVHSSRPPPLTPLALRSPAVPSAQTSRLSPRLPPARAAAGLRMSREYDETADAAAGLAHAVLADGELQVRSRGCCGVWWLRRRGCGADGADLAARARGVTAMRRRKA